MLLDECPFDEPNPVTYDKRMPEHVHQALCTRLLDQMESPNVCDHTLTLTRAFMRRRRRQPTDQAIAWLKEHGGYCDCEVLLNTAPEGYGFDGFDFDVNEEQDGEA